MANRQEWIELREAARRLGLRPDWVYKMVWKGRLIAKKVDGRWQVLVASVEARKRFMRARDIAEHGGQATA